MRIANPFRYSFREPYKSEMSVYKCWFGKRYFLWYSKALHSSVNQMAIELDRRLRLGITEDDLYYKVVRYIRSSRIGLFEVEVTKFVDSPLEMLKLQHKALQKAKNDVYCLNNRFDPHVPAWVPETDKAEYVKWAADTTKRAARKTDKPKVSKIATKKKVLAKKASK